MPVPGSEPIAAVAALGALLASAGLETAATYSGRKRDGGLSGTRGWVSALGTTLFVHREGSRQHDRRTLRIALLGVGSGLVAAWLAGLHPTLSAGSDDVRLFWAALSVWLAGVGLRSWAVFALGPAFTRQIDVRHGQRVVTQGPYRCVRHPAYTGTLVAVSAIGAILGGWAGGAAALVFATAGFLPRIRQEDALLHEQLGEPYAAYARKRARIAPYVW